MMYQPFFPSLAAHTTHDTTDAALQQNAAEICHFLTTQLGSKSGRPIILPYATPFAEQLLDARGLSLLPEAGYAPFMHFVVHAEAAEQMSSDAEAERDIDAQIRGVVISETCYALLYQFNLGEQSLCCVFDASDPTINRAFRPWLHQGYIPAVISSPLYRCVVHFPCYTPNDWRPFMNRAAAAVGLPLQTPQAFLSELMQESSLAKLAGFGDSELVLGTSLQQILSLAPSTSQDDDTPAVY